MKPKISLIIPVYQVEDYIADCLLSCLNQDNVILGKDYEIIIVNDGTKDSSIEIAKNIIHRKNGCQIISQSNKGLSAARNTGLKNANGEFVWFIDSDDWIEKNSVRNLISIIEKNASDIIVFQSISYTIYGEKRKDELVSSTCILSGTDVFNGIKWETCVPFYSFKKSFLNKNEISFLEGIYHEDNEFTPRALILANKITVTNLYLYNYRLTERDSITQKRNIKKSYDLITVCDSLHEFANSHPELISKVRIKFNRFLSMSFNSSLWEISTATRKEKKEFNKYLSSKKHLFVHLIKSKQLKCMAEYALFRLNPIISFISSYCLLKWGDNLVRRKIAANK